MQRHSFRDIALFVAAYEECSFTAAAERENATQSGVSQHIRKLEDSFGVSLFFRSAGSVAPTPAADVYYRHCLEVLRSSSRAQNELLAYSGALAGEVSVGLIPSLCRTTLAPVLTRFSQANPNVRVSILDGFSALLIEKVAAGELAFAIVPAEAVPPGLAMRPLFRTPEVFVRRRRVDQALSRSVDLAQLGPLQIVLPTAQNARRVMLEQYLSANNVTVDRYLEMDTMLGCLDLVAQSDWVTILPGIILSHEILGQTESPFEIAALEQGKIEIPISLIHRLTDELSPAAAAFLATFERQAMLINDALCRKLAKAPPTGAP